MFVISIIGDSLGVAYKLISAINYNPFSHPMAVMIIIFAMLVSTFFIFLFNYTITFKELIIEKQLRLKVALVIAIITTPWTFLLPTQWFYN